MKYSTIALFILTILCFTACDTDEILNPIPETVIGQNGFFENDDQVFQGIMGVYDAIQGVNENTTTNWTTVNRGIQFEYLLTEMRSDNTRSATTEGSKADFHRYLVNANNIESEDYYASMYEIIFRANNVLENLENANPDNVAAYTAELQFLRAFAYFNLVRLYGDVPLVTSTIGPSDESAFIRVDKQTVYGQIVTDLTDAANTLTYGGPKSRASKGAAETLLAKVYLSMPNPEYLLAQGLLENVIGQYRLLDNFNDVFYSELNDELIFVVEYISGNGEESQSFSSEFTSEAGRQDGLNIMENGLVQAFDLNGGNRTVDSYLVLNNLPQCAKYLPDGFDSTQDFGPNTRQAGNDWIILRYADVLLMHAEAVLAGAQSTTSTNALNSINEVRMRAELDDLEAPLTADDILMERRVELAFENHRFYDLQRFGVINTVLADYAAENGYDFNVNQLLLPIPAREVNQSDGLLTQNPGY